MCIDDFDARRRADEKVVPVSISWYWVTIKVKWIYPYFFVEETLFENRMLKIKGFEKYAWQAWHALVVLYSSVWVSAPISDGYASSSKWKRFSDEGYIKYKWKLCSCWRIYKVRFEVSRSRKMSPIFWRAGNDHLSDTLKSMCSRLRKFHWNRPRIFNPNNNGICIGTTCAGISFGPIGL